MPRGGESVVEVPAALTNLLVHIVFLRRVDREAASAGETIDPPTPLQRHTPEGFEEWVTRARVAMKAAHSGDGMTPVNAESFDAIEGGEAQLDGWLQPFWDHLERAQNRELWEIP